AAANGIDFGDYIGLTFNAGRLCPVWSDNSNSTVDNPNGGNSKFDVYTSRVMVLSDGQPGRYGVVAGPAQSPANLNFANHDVVPPKVLSAVFNVDPAPGQPQPLSFNLSENVTSSLASSGATLLRNL